MKIHVMRRDGKSVNTGMSISILKTAKNIFEDDKVTVKRKEDNFTQILALDVPNASKENVYHFVVAITDLSDKYAIRIPG